MNTKKKILIADDEAASLDFFELMLSNLGFTVEKVEDGDEVINMVKKFNPDLILLDNIMPGKTGWEVTKILRNDPNYKQTPIIMISALDDVKDKVAAFDAGVNDYITKPFNFSEVLARITAVLKNRELFDQVAVRETRLILAEELNKDLKDNLLVFIDSIDELERAIQIVTKNGEKADWQSMENTIKQVNEKILSVRKHIAALDARIEKTTNEWNNLKKGEIGLSILENQSLKFTHQE